MSARGLIFDIQRFCLHDGPGIRTTLFLKGCPLRCRWCHNPEGLLPKPQLRFDAARCIGCGLCVHACPRGVHSAQGHDFAHCEQCGACIAQCPSRALTFAGRWYTVEEAMKAIREDFPFYADGGGVTFSGGEALMQADFMREMLPRCKAEGLHTAVDTCGALEWDSYFAPVLAWTDVFLYDLKAFEPEVHRRATGRDNALILDNYRRLLDAGKTVWVRIPVVNGYNVGEMEALAQFLDKHRGAAQIELMPYHTLGRGKYAQLGLEVACNSSQCVSDEQMQEIWQHFHDRQLPVQPLR